MRERPTVVDLNADLGEGVGNEAQLMPLLSSCNIACGGHAGDPSSIREMLVLAKQHGVKAGAHPSYPDREHFGRRSLKLAPAVLQKSLEAQLGQFQKAAAELGVDFHHIKAHGALYNDLAGDAILCANYLRVLEPFRDRIRIFGPCGSEFVQRARLQGFEVWEEAFADRTYNRDGTLVSRRIQGSLLTQPKAVWQQLKEMIFKGRVQTSDGSFIPMDPNTYCLHGDTPNALEILMYLSRKLSSEFIRIDK
jgi:UPF0271 protein